MYVFTIASLKLTFASAASLPLKIDGWEWPFEGAKCQLLGSLGVVAIKIPNSPGNLFLREPQHTPKAYPMNPQTPKWKEFLHKLLVGGLGYVPGVCWKILRLFEQNWGSQWSSGKFPQFYQAIPTWTFRPASGCVASKMELVLMNKKEGNPGKKCAWELGNHHFLLERPTEFNS